MSGELNKEKIDVSVVLPVYNEKEAIRASVLDMKEAMDKLPYSYEIVLVDDGSTDDCLDEVADLGAIVVRHDRNRGGGVARVTGMLTARGSIIVQSDVDGTYPTEKLGEMLELMRTADLVIGARDKESQKRLFILRILMKGLIRKIAEFLTNSDIPDLNSGLRVYRKDIALRYVYLYPAGHSIMSTMTIAFLSEGFRVRFVPIGYNKRVGSTSFHIVKDTYNYLQVTISTVAFFNPLRVLMPIFLFMVGLSCIFTVRDAFRLGLGPMTVLLWVMSFLVIILAIISEQITRLARYLAFIFYNKRAGDS